MPANDHFREAMRRLHDVYHADPEADIHPAPDLDGIYRQPQPGTAAFMRERLVGPGQAPERFIERIDGVGPEGLGVVELIDGKTGKSLRRLKQPRIGLDRD